MEIKHNNHIDGYVNLGNAIVALAAYDYYNAVKSYYKSSWCLGTYYRVKELERFFKSDWCCLISGMDTDYIISICQRKAKEICKK